MDETKRFARRLAASICALAVALGCMCTLIGCGPSDEEMCKEAVDSTLSQFKNVDDELLDSVLDELPSSLQSSYESVGLDFKAMFKSWLDGYDYKLDSLQIDGNKATANVTVTCKKLMPAMTQGADKATSDFASGTVLPKTQDEATKYVAQKMMDALDAAQPEQIDTTLSLEKKDGKWEPASGNAGSIGLLYDMMGANEALEAN